MNITDEKKERSAFSKAYALFVTAVRDAFKKK